MLNKYEDVAEAEGISGWVELSIADALSRRPGTRLRCIGCGGQLRAHKLGTTGQRAHFEHRERHEGCPKVTYFDGKSRPHPHPLS